MTVSGEGKHVIGARILDNAGNISALIGQPVNIDLTPPAVAVTGVQNGGSYTEKGNPPSPACQTADALSGVAVNATLAVTQNPGRPRRGYRSYTATCSGAQDKAGNLAAPVSVTYQVKPGR
ncbi:MAG: hypothetical protein ACRD4O_19010 [Bryobacteraceae bacterium]